MGRLPHPTHLPGRSSPVTALRQGSSRAQFHVLHTRGVSDTGAKYCEQVGPPHPLGSSWAIEVRFSIASVSEMGYPHAQYSSPVKSFTRGIPLPPHLKGSRRPV